jgi:hypothetical protein
LNCSIWIVRIHLAID